MHKVDPSGLLATNEPCMFPTHYVIVYKRASSEEKYHVLAFTFKTVIHIQQML